jgi:hypothetical protein
MVIKLKGWPGRPASVTDSAQRARSQVSLPPDHSERGLSSESAAGYGWKTMNIE